MNTRLTLDYTYCTPVLTPELWDGVFTTINAAHTKLLQRVGKGNEFLGWIDLPSTMKKQSSSLRETAERISETCDALIVIGIGGSYLGARAVIEALRAPFEKHGTEIYYAGNHLDGEYLKRLLAHLQDRSVSVNVVSKSGTTTEPALAFRIVKEWMENKYGKEESRKRIVATTDASRGALKQLADSGSYPTFVIPDNVGGRFSVLTPVGLLPIAVAGIDVVELLDGAEEMMQRAAQPSFETNPSFVYAMIRCAMAVQGKKIETLSTFAPQLSFIGEWWKQLYGESEGKKGKGIFPATCTFTTDLHSMGQYLQEGPRMLFETFLTVRAPREDLCIPGGAFGDGLEYLNGESLSSINEKAYRGTALAHLQGGVPNMCIALPDLSAHAIGELLYFFEYAVALSGYALEINPFDQPGVEAYKKNMFALLGKEGFEREREMMEEEQHKHAVHRVE